MKYIPRFTATSPKSLQSHHWPWRSLSTSLINLSRHSLNSIYWISEHTGRAENPRSIPFLLILYGFSCLLKNWVHHRINKWQQISSRSKRSHGNFFKKFKNHQARARESSRPRVWFLFCSSLVNIYLFSAVSDVNKSSFAKNRNEPAKKPAGFVEIYPRKLNRGNNWVFLFEHSTTAATEVNWNQFYY